MKIKIKNGFLIAIGWFFVVLAIIGVLLPILPTTPFLILALAFFSKSSPRFHKMLLDNKWFGASLKQWEQNKTLSRKTKYKASVLIVITFAISIGLLYGRVKLQFMLVGIALVLLLFIWRIKENSAGSKNQRE